MSNLSSIKHAIQRVPANIADAGRSIGRSASHKASALIAEARSSLGQRDPSAPAKNPRAVRFAERNDVRTIAARPKFVASSKPVIDRPRDAMPGISAHRAPVAGRNRTPEQIETDKLIDALEIQLEIAELDDAIDLSRQAMAAKPSNPEEVNRAFEDMLKQLDSEDLEAVRQHEIDEVTSLLDQQDQEIALKNPRPAAAQSSGAAKAAGADAAQAQLDDSTAELTALLDGLKQDVVQRRTAHIAQESEMRSASKASVPAPTTTTGTQAVVESLDAQRQIKLPVFRRPQQPLMAEAATLATEPVVESTR